MTANTGKAIAETERERWEADAKAGFAAAEYMSAPQLEQITGTPASTWRYWAHIGSGPPSFKLGRRRVWKRSTVLTWIAEQERTSA